MLGIFDSGIGGLSVVKELLRRYPQAGFTYLGDTARAPYGNRSPETITRYAIQDAHFLIEKGATTILVACNTASAVAIDELRSTFPGTRFFEVISPAVHAAKGKTVGVVGTRATIASGIYERHLKETNPSVQVISRACPLFVPLVEENWIKKPETKRIIRAYLEPLRRAQIDHLILGCTHYPMLAEVIKSSLQKKVRIIDSPRVLIDQVAHEAPEAIVDGMQEYFFTDPSSHTDTIASRWLGRAISGKHATLR